MNEIDTIKEKLKAMVHHANSRIMIESEKVYEMNFKEIGIDSLDLMSILFSVQDEYDLEIPDEDIDKLVSLNTLARYIEKNK